MGEKPRISFCQKYTATSIALVRPNAKYNSKNGRYILTRRVISRAISRIERYSPFLRCGIVYAVLRSVNLQGPIDVFGFFCVSQRLASPCILAMRLVFSPLFEKGGHFEFKVPML